MKRFSAVVMMLCLGMLVGTSNAQAQTCTDQQTADFRTCIDAGITACNSDNCTEACSVVTYSEVVDEIIDDCCGITKKKKRNRCLRARQRDYKKRARLTVQKVFNAKIIARIKALRRTCGGSTR